MAVTSYSTLLAAITTRLGDTAQDSERDTFIDFAEAYFNRTLRHTAMEEQTTLTTDADGLATLPTGLLAIRSVRYDGSPLVELAPMSMGGVNNLSPYNASGTVYGYVITSISNVQKIRTLDPLATGDLILTYFEKLPPLSDSQTTNWLLDLAPDAYFYRCMAEAYTARQAFDKAAGLTAHVEEICGQLNALDERARYGNAEIVLDGVNP